jgi:hypothetical protein
MNPPRRCGQILHHVTERAAQCSAAPDQYVIMAGLQRVYARQSHHFTQAAPHAVALHGISDLPRYGEPDAHRVTIGAAACLQHESCRRRPHCTGGCPKINPALQPLHGTQAWLGRLQPEQVSAEATQSGTQALTPMSAAGCHDLPAAFGRHAGAKAVAALAHQFTRLIGPFHGSLLRSRSKMAGAPASPVDCASGGACRAVPIGSAGGRLRRLIRDPSGAVKSAFRRTGLPRPCRSQAIRMRWKFVPSGA